MNYDSMGGQEQLRVLYLINGLGTGGAERSLAEFLPAARELGVEVDVVCLYERSEGVQAPVERVHTVHFLRASTNIGRILEVRRILRRVRPHLLHTTIFDSNFVGRLAAAGTGVPVLTSLVNTSYSRARFADPNLSAWRLGVVRWIDGLTARHLTTHFHAITHAVRDEMARALRIPRERVTVVERGRGTERLGEPTPDRRARVRAALGIAPETLLLLNVGRQEYQKGQSYLIESLPRLAGDVPNLALIIAGREGHASNELRRIVRSRSMEARVRFLGHREDVPDLLVAADVFVFPSVYEGLGGAVIEALAMGVPVVASRTPALEEVLEEGRLGILVPPCEPDALATAISRLLRNMALRAELARRGRAAFERRFGLDRATRGMVDLYRDVASEGSRSSRVGPYRLVRALSP